MKAVQVYFDGGVRPIPEGGFAKCLGWLIKVGQQTIVKGSSVEVVDMNAGSSHVEFEALIRALDAVGESGFTSSSVTVHGDSRTVIEICSGIGSAKSAAGQKFADIVQNSAKRLSAIEYVWIPRSLNHEADRLGRDAYDQATRLDERVTLMSKVNIAARRRFGSFYDRQVMYSWCEEVVGKRRLSTMSVAELGKLLHMISDIPNFVRRYISARESASQSVTA